MEQLKRDLALVEHHIASRGRTPACTCRYDGEPRPAANAGHGDVLIAFLTRATDDVLRSLGIDA
jgi:hypothetical protein